MATKKASAPKGLAEARATLSKRTTPKSIPADTPTSAAEWKKASVEGMLVRVPSGKTMRIKTPGMDVFLREGVIPNTLIPVVQSMMSKGGKATDADVEELMQDSEALMKIIDLADAVCVFCALEPKVHEIPNVTVERNQEWLYVDEVDFVDKMFIFSAATGGPSEMEKFRSLTNLDVGPVPNS